MPPVSRGFKRRRAPVDPARVPPGQHVEPGFPVLSIGPTPRVATTDWSLTLDGAVDRARRWSWEELLALPKETVRTDIHCVTQWTKLGTTWGGVAVDTLLEGVRPGGAFVTVVADGDYTTNLPLADLTGGRAWIAYEYEGAPLAAEHGGPARLLVPHLYFWKSAKWVRGLSVTVQDEPGFWERNGYHRRGDPWAEERYWDD